MCSVFVYLYDFHVHFLQFFCHCSIGHRTNQRHSDLQEIAIIAYLTFIFWSWILSVFYFNHAFRSYGDSAGKYDD